MSTITKCSKFESAERIEFSDQEDHEWAYMRVGYGDDAPLQKYNWFKARMHPFGFDLVLEDQQLEAIYQERSKEQQA